MKTIIYYSLFLICLSVNNDVTSDNINLNAIFNEVGDTNFNGLWINENEQTRALTKCKIRQGENNYVVELWGKCSPEDCYWGELNSGEINGDEKEIELYLENFFSKRDITLQIIEERLKIVTRVQYKDGRQERTSTDYFVKQ